MNSFVGLLGVSRDSRVFVESFLRLPTPSFLRLPTPNPDPSASEPFAYWLLAWIAGIEKSVDATIQVQGLALLALVDKCGSVE